MELFCTSLNMTSSYNFDWKLAGKIYVIQYRFPTNVWKKTLRHFEDDVTISTNRQTALDFMNEDKHLF